MPRLSVCVVAASLVVLSACASGEAALRDPSPEALQAAYAAAIEDAQTADSSEIVSTLTPITPNNPALTWDTTITAAGDTVQTVRVVHWTGGFDDVTPGDTVTVRPNRPLWVTAVPEIRRFCHNVDRSGAALAMRLRQRLGLPPDAAYVRFVTFRVAPDALARPCPDPEITDRTCDLALPDALPSTHAELDHRVWFACQRSTSYGSDGYPWTRLGYTYDWARPGGDEVGTSEFIVRPGATVVVESVAPTDAYCE